MRKPYSLLLLWRERNRYFPAVFAVGFSCLLIAVEFGLLFGTLAKLSQAIDRSGADIWVTSPNVPSIELGHPIPEQWRARLMQQPEVRQVETFLYGVGFWKKPGFGSEFVCVIGCRLEDGTLGPLRDLPPELRVKLTEPGAVVVDESELGRLGLKGVGDVIEVSGQRTRLVGMIRGYKSPGPALVFCSLRTARRMLPQFRDNPRSAMYLLVRCRQASDVPVVLERLRQFPHMSAYTRSEFSRRMQGYWLTRTNVGIGMACTAALALLVSMVVTSQTLYAAVASALREYAVLRALGIPRRRVAKLVLTQAFWIGVGGVIAAVPVIYVLKAAADGFGADVQLPWWLLAASAAVTLVVSLVSGLGALRSLRLVEPVTLLR